MRDFVTWDGNELSPIQSICTSHGCLAHHLLQFCLRGFRAAIGRRTFSED